MKIILAIFAIAFAAVLFVRPPDDAQPSGEAPPGVSAAINSAAVVQNPPAAAPNAALPASTSAAPNVMAQDLLRAAQQKLDGHLSISARLRYRVQMFGNELIGSGAYEQSGQGSARRFRLELKTQVGDKVVSQQQVCDGKALWTYRENATGAQIDWLDLERVRAALRQSANLPQTTQVQEPTTGGLPKLLEAFEAHFNVSKAEEGYLGELPAWAIELQWQPSVLAALVPDQQQQIIAANLCDFTKLPQIPEHVQLFLGREDLFPRRIEFHGRSGQSSGGSDALQSGTRGATAFVVAEFTDIRFDQPIDPRQFEYRAAEARDVTAMYLQGRGLPVGK